MKEMSKTTTVTIVVGLDRPMAVAVASGVVIASASKERNWHI